MADPAYADTEQAKDIPTDNMMPEDIAEDIPEAAVSEDISTIDTLATVETASTEKPVIESIPEEPVAESIPEEPVAESIPEEAVTNTTESPDNLGIEGKSSNDMLSADEIAALFAAADPAPKKEEPVTEETEDAEPFTPTFTVVGKSTEGQVKQKRQGKGEFSLFLSETHPFLLSEVRAPVSQAFRLKLQYHPFPAYPACLDISRSLDS